MHVGDSWSYAQTTDTGKGPSESAWSRKVVAVGADGGFDFQIGERVHKYDAAGNYLDPKGAEYNRTVYQFPMQVGSEWSYVAKFGTQVMMDQRGSYKVVAYEPLTAPAGTFDCFKVEGKAEAAYRYSYQQQIRETYWYCPKVERDREAPARGSRPRPAIRLRRAEDRIGADEVHAEGLSGGRARPPRARRSRPRSAGEPPGESRPRIGLHRHESMSRNAGRNPPDFHARYPA